MKPNYTTIPHLTLKIAVNYIIFMFVKVQKVPLTNIKYLKKLMPSLRLILANVQPYVKVEYVHLRHQRNYNLPNKELQIP